VPDIVDVPANSPFKSWAALELAAAPRLLTELGATVRPSTPEEFAAFQKTNEAGVTLVWGHRATAPATDVSGHRSGR